MSTVIERKQAVVDELTGKLDARARAIAPLGVRADFSGPWAPYRFIGDEV